jgi:hypothetical protein
MKPSDFLQIRVELMKIAMNYASNSYTDFVKKYEDLQRLIELKDFQKQPIQ